MYGTYIVYIANNMRIRKVKQHFQYGHEAKAPQVTTVLFKIYCIVLETANIYYRKYMNNLK